MPSRERVVVCGAGFAGLNVAKRLEADKDVTLVAPTDQFVYLPLIHEVLSESVQPPDVARDLGEVLTETTLVHGRAVEVTGNEVRTGDGDRLPFDKLVVAIGAEPNDFGVPGVADHALSFYSVGDALRANATLKTAASEHTGEDPLVVRVVGASFTGVEVAGEVADLLDKLDIPRKVVLHDALEEIFPHQGETFREGVHEGLKRQGLELRTEQMVARIREDALVLASEDEHEPGRVLPADVIFWCAGVRPRVLPGVTHQVRDTLQTWDREDVFVVGDAAQFPPERGVPRLAQTAEDQAKIAAANILDSEAMQAYDPRVKGLIVSIGHGYAVAELAGGQVFKGKVPWHIKRNLYKVKIRLA